MPRAKSTRRRPAPPDPALLRALAPAVSARLGPAAGTPFLPPLDAPAAAPAAPEPAKLTLPQHRGDRATGMQAPEAQVFALSALLGVLQPTRENIATKMDVAVEVMGEIAPTNALEALSGPDDR